jgi:hypothetical protein
MWDGDKEMNARANSRNRRIQHHGGRDAALEQGVLEFTSSHQRTMPADASASNWKIRYDTTDTSKSQQQGGDDQVRKWKLIRRNAREGGRPRGAASLIGTAFTIVWRLDPWQGENEESMWRPGDGF